MESKTNCKACVEVFGPRKTLGLWLLVLFIMAPMMNEARRDRIVPSFCACPRIFEPICGTNNVTYPNFCILECTRKETPGYYLKPCCLCQCPCPCERHIFNFYNLPDPFVENKGTSVCDPAFHLLSVNYSPATSPDTQ